MLISQEHAYEYKQVAALTCMDIDLLADIVSEETLTLEQLKDQILNLKRMKDEVIADKAIRDMRYDATVSIFSLIDKQQQ